MINAEFDLGRDMYFPIKPSKGTYPSSRKRIVEEPIVLWRPEYEKNPGKFMDLIQHLSDYMLLNGSGLYDDDNPNHPGLFNIAKGIVPENYYESAEYPYGYKGTTPIRNNRFFYSSKEHTRGEIVKQPFRFLINDLNNDYTEKKFKRDEKTTRRLMKTLLAKVMREEEGVNMDFMEDKTMNLEGGTGDEILDRLYAQGQLENTIHKIIQSLNYKHDIQSLAKDCFDNKYDINSEFAFIDVRNGDVVPTHVHPSNVRWISGKPVKTFEDPSVKAVSLINYLTVPEMVNNYSEKLETGTGAKGLLDAIDKILEGKSVNYDPTRAYFSEYYKNNTLRSDVNLPEIPNAGFGKVDYFRNIFYPYRNTPYGIGTSVLEQKMFFKIFVEKNYIVEINGKATNAREFEKWQKEDFNRELSANFIELGTEEKAPKGSFKVTKHKQELWEATRLGHGTLVNVGRYEHSIKTKDKQTYVGMPVIAQISRDESIVLIGENVARIVNVLMARVEELIDRAGASSAVMIDEAVLSAQEAKGGMFNAKKAGIFMFNSHKMNGSNQFGAQHLGVLKMSNELEEMNNFLAMIGMLTEGFNRKVGTSQTVLGAGNPYESNQQQQTNISNQEQLKGIKYWEHNLFMNQVLQRMADIAKNVFARDGQISVTLSNGQREVLRLTKDLKLADFDLKLESGASLLDKKATIDNAIMQVLPSGGIENLGAMLRILWAEDPNEAMALFDRSKEQIMKAQQAQMQAQAQQAQAQAQLQAQKIQVPVDVANLNAQKEFQLQKMKEQNEREKENFKGTIADIQESNNRENKLLDHDLAKDIESHRQALNLSIDQLLSESQPKKAPQLA